MSKKDDLSFRAFLRKLKIKQLFEKEDPFTCGILEYFCNTLLACILMIFLHPLTVIVTIPWTFIRISYWIWRDVKEKR